MERYLERAGVEIRTVDAPAEIPAALDILYDLHARRWSSRRQSGNFRDPRVRAFHAQMAASLAPAHRARVCMLSHPTGPVAALYALEYKDTFFFYQSGFDPDAGRLGLKPHEYSPGFVLVHHCMLDAVRRGVALFDFLRGPEEYKFRWTKESRVTRCLTVVPRANVAALGKHHIGRGLALSRRAVKRILGWKTQAGGGRP
jgi:CelD/BcsL family acetyltransferase involved in cellulose biosynthesis